MLSIFGRFFEDIRAVRTEGDIREILADVARDFDFHSGFLVQYVDEFRGIKRIIDTNPDRADAWRENFRIRMHLAPSTLRSVLAETPVFRVGKDRLDELDAPTRIFVRQYDLVDCVVVPVSHSGVIVGLVGFSGVVDLREDQHAVLPLIVYSLFAEAQALEPTLDDRPSVSLTPRESEVMLLSSDGLTSPQISARLGIAARTVNQHFDNAARKLGTRNRAHTIAEAIRRGLLT